MRQAAAHPWKVVEIIVVVVVIVAAAFFSWPAFLFFFFFFFFFFGKGERVPLLLLFTFLGQSVFLDRILIVFFPRRRRRRGVAVTASTSDCGGAVTATISWQAKQRIFFPIAASGTASVFWHFVHEMVKGMMHLLATPTSNP